MTKPRLIATGKGRARLPHPEDKPTLTVAEAAPILGVSRNSLYEAVRRGEIPALRVGSRWLLPTAAIRSLLHLDDDDQAAAATLRRLLEKLDQTDGGDAAA